MSKNKYIVISSARVEGGRSALSFLQHILAYTFKFTSRCAGLVRGNRNVYNLYLLNGHSIIFSSRKVLSDCCSSIAYEIRV